jgi:hypothetical protein
MIGYGGGNVLLPLSNSNDGGTTWVTNVSTLSDIRTFVFRSEDISSNVDLSTTGNVSANNVIVTTDVETTGNVSANNVIVTTDVETTGNVSATYFLGNGSQLTGLGLHYGNSDAVNLLASFGSNTIETTGNITGGNVNGDNVIADNITVSANITADYYLNLRSIPYTVAGTTYSLVDGDQDRTIVTTSSSNVTITVEDDSTVEFPLGTSISILQVGTGQVTLANAATVTLNSPGNIGALSNRYQFTTCGVYKYAANTWVAFGDLVV